MSDREILFQDLRIIHELVEGDDPDYALYHIVESYEGDDKPICKVCEDEGWVCEDHPDKAWGGGDGCCGGAGKPCECNTANPPWANGFDNELN